MPQETVSPQLPAGAGRWQDWVWPDPIITTLSSSSVLSMRNRLTGASVVVVAGNFGSGGAGTLGAQFEATLGAGIIRLFGSALDGQGQLMRVTAPLVLTRLIQNAVPAGYDDLGVWRVFANMAWTAPIGGTVDNGLQIVRGASPIIASATPGFGFNRSSAGRIALLTRDDVGTLVSTNLTGPGTTMPAFDETQLHTYEFQILNATANVEAALRVLIDGVLVASRSWGVGTVLPTPVNTTMGFFTQLFCVSSNSVLRVQALRMVAAPSLLMTY